MNINNYDDFVSALFNAGFSMSGGNDEGVFAIIPFSWGETPEYDTPVQWHTGNPDTDPWEWRMRVLDERVDVAYAKVFFNKGGFITRQWYPYFLAARRGKATFKDDYAAGKISHYAKTIYEVIGKCENGMPLDMIKQQAGFSKDEKSKFERAMVELQMKLYITMCGRQQKISQNGTEYGWAATVFTTTENFWNEDVFAQASRISAQDAVDKIQQQVLALNPHAAQKKIAKFIRG